MARTSRNTSKAASKPYDRPSAKSSKAESSSLPASLSTGAVNVGAPATSQKSRKGKKAWRKNVDIAGEETALERAREEERITGGKVADKTNDDLFTVDTVGDVEVAQRLRRAPKPLRSLAVLSERSAVPSLTSRAGPSTIKKPTKISSAEKSRLRNIARKQALTPGEEATSSADVKTISKPFKDAWVEQQIQSAPGGFGDEGMIKRTVKQPTTIERQREIYLKTQVEGRKAVETPDGGTSYNPSNEEHLRLINKAAEEERELLAREEKEQKRAKGGEAVLNARRVVNVNGGEEYAPGMTVGPGEEGEDEEVEDLEVAKIVKKVTKRKTQAQRNKAMRKKEAVQLALLEATQKKMAKAAGNAANLKLSLEKQRAAQAEAEKLAKLVKKEKERLGLIGGEKIGKHRVGKGKVAVQLGEDLAETLRQVKPEGNLFKDRFLALQKRALIEPRVPQLPKRKALRTKEYEKHAYKNFLV